MAQDYTPLIETYAAKFGIPVALAVAQHHAEDGPTIRTLSRPPGPSGCSN